MIFASAPTAADYWMLFTIFVLLIALTGLSLAEMSLSRITKQKAQALFDQHGKHAKVILKLAEDPTKWVNPLLLTVNIFQTVQATLTGIVAGRLFGAPGVAIGVTLNVVVFFVLAEAVPKTYGLIHPVRGATLTAVTVNALTSFYPLRMISQELIKLTNAIVRGKGLAAGPFISEQEFLGIVEAAAQDAVIEHEERELIESVIEFGDTVVREIMVPRPDVVTINDDLTITQAIDIIVDSQLSRLPVLRADDDDQDDLVGVVYAKDLIAAERAGRGAESIRGTIHSVEVVPEMKLVADLMRQMQQDKFHLAMVADEYGLLAGLVTLEDCLEELVGEIGDEHDEDDTSVQLLPNGDLLVAGVTTIGKLNEILETEISAEDYDTIGGLVFGKLGHVPEVGESVTNDQLVFRVEELDGRRIQVIRISQIKK
ncbi:MAG: hemolysin family protein [Actinomycetota bacterium]|nr:hemolysin family protein [Actinomycetota bacterium]MDA3004273.1 hemolysin family protein [Actinomycetota bacterium]